MVFILHNQKNVNTIAGGSIGYAGLSPSLVIEMDTYTNGSVGDPNYDHLGLMLNGNHNHSQDLINNIPIDPGFANVEDCIYHQAQINWLADEQILEFYWDCELRFSTSIDIKEDVFPNSNEIYWGFIATTGGAVNTHAICFTTPPENVEEIELEDITICEGESIQLNAALGYDNYFWSPDTGLSDPNSPSPVLQAISSTTYTLQAFNNCGQISEDTFSLEVIDNVTPNQDLYSLDICPNTELLITGPANFESYHWTPEDLFDTNDEQQVSLIADVDTEIMLSVINECGSEFQITYEVSLKEVDDLIPLEDIDFCPGDWSDLQAQDGFISYEWKNDSGNIIGDEQKLDIQLSENGTIFLLMIDECGFTLADTILVSKEEEIQIEQFLSDSSICLNTNLQVKASDNFESYAWYDVNNTLITEEQSISIIGESPSMYHYVAEDICGLEKRDSIEIEIIFPLDLSTFIEDQSICLGESVEITLDNSFESFTFLAGTGIEQGNAQNKVKINPETSTLYLIEYSDFCNFTQEDEFSIEVKYSPPMVDLPNNIDACFNQPIMLDAATSADDIQYSWSDGSSQEQLIVYEAKEISLRMSNDCGENQYWINIEREDCRNFYAPNIFSPNGDGYNDYFTLVGKDIDQIEHFEIYDRWGNKVFGTVMEKPISNTPGWDGSFNGKSCQEGVYTWVAKVRFIDQSTESLSGSFLLKK